jgi:hypothetical protein
MAQYALITATKVEQKARKAGNKKQGFLSL